MPRSQVYSGNLTVPLSPHEEDANETPFIDLLVLMTIHNSVQDAARDELRGGRGAGLGSWEIGKSSDFAQKIRGKPWETKGFIG